MYQLRDSKISVCVIHLWLSSNGFILLSVLLYIERNMRGKISASELLVFLFGSLSSGFIKTLRFGILVFPIPGWTWDLSYKNILQFSLDKIGTTLFCVVIFYSILIHPLSMQDMLSTFPPVSDISLPMVFRCFFMPEQATTTTTSHLSPLISSWLLILTEISCLSWTSWLLELKLDVNMVRNLPVKEVAVA